MLVRVVGKPEWEPFPEAAACWFSPRKGAVPHSGTAWGLGQGAVGRRLSEQQRLSQQPQILAAGLRTERGVCCRPAETQGACHGPGRPGSGTGEGRVCREEPGQLPERGLPGRGPAYLEGNSSWAWLPVRAWECWDMSERREPYLPHPSGSSICWGSHRPNSAQPGPCLSDRGR